MTQCLACSVSASAGTRPTRRSSGSPARWSRAAGSWSPGPRRFRRRGPPPAGAYPQARLCLDLIGEALARAGASLEDVVRTRIYLTDAGHWSEVARAHGEAFADIRPAATAVVVSGLLDPAWLVEIEAEALLPDP